MCIKISTLVNDYYGGNKAALAADAGVSRQAVTQWGGDTCLDADYVIPVCAGLSWQITPHLLRPDIYPNATDALPEKAKEAKAA